VWLKDAATHLRDVAELEAELREERRTLLRLADRLDNIVFRLHVIEHKHRSSA
jgi:hypothetical protein